MSQSLLDTCHFSAVTGIIRWRRYEWKQNCVPDPVVLQNLCNAPDFTRFPAKEQQVLAASWDTSLVHLWLSLLDSQTIFHPLQDLFSLFSYLLFCSLPLALCEEQFHRFHPQIPNSSLCLATSVLFFLPAVLHG